jgi:beta-barrel assembly-enhancing protease
VGNKFVKYSNPKIPEGINISPEHPLKEFAVLAGGILAVLAIAAFCLSLLADQIARRIPFAYEKSLASEYEASLPEPRDNTKYLQSLANRLTPNMAIPEDMSITVHYVDEDIINAYATIGGHVIIYRGLVERLSNENALAMVLAHEIAHVKYRHPIRSLGRGVVVGLALAVLTGISGNDLVGTALGDAGLLTLLTFSREQEREADRTGLEAVEKLYGHVSGSLDLYRVLLNTGKQKYVRLPAFLSTHPLTKDRIQELEAFIKENGWDRQAPTKMLSAPLSELRGAHPSSGPNT